MKPDILTRDNIKHLIDQFYNKVQQDGLIGVYFTEVAKVDWNHHLPQMYDFWESILFSKNVFNGNPMRKHIELNEKRKLDLAHFEHWLLLFHSTTDELFEGANATRIKEYAAIIKENLTARVLNRTEIAEPRPNT